MFLCFSCDTQSENQRLMDVKFDFTLKGSKTLKIDRTWQVE